ncbi:MAG: MarR family transcriptional regulator [Marmoricola sp.]|nr:MarR family transcriptional regulator [Marmoricola sp.]
MTPSPTIHEGSAALAEDLRTVVGRLVRRLRAGYAIAPHQFSVLSTIERSGPLTASQLATLEIVRPQSMAHTLHQLAEAGFVTRSPDPGDGRQTLIALSDAGRLAIEEQRRETTNWLSAAIDHELDTGERAALATAVGLLGRLVER